MHHTLSSDRNGASQHEVHAHANYRDGNLNRDGHPICGSLSAAKLDACPVVYRVHNGDLGRTLDVSYPRLEALALLFNDYWRSIPDNRPVTNNEQSLIKNELQCLT